jgi:threonine/homoserine/homoserine lactone efflux protein
MSLDLWLAFVAASTALLLIPGPTVLLVLSYALSKGRSVAVASAAGVALGDLVAMTASLLGLGALVLTSAGVPRGVHRHRSLGRKDARHA